MFFCFVFLGCLFFEFGRYVVRKVKLVRLDRLRVGVLVSSFVEV